MNCAKVRVFEETNEVRFATFLQSQYCRTLKSYVGLEVLCNLAHETLKRQPAKEQVATFLVATYLLKGARARTVPMGLFDASRGRRRLPGRFGGQLLAWGFPTRTFTGGLLGPGHGVVQVVCAQDISMFSLHTNCSLGGVPRVSNYSRVSASPPLPNVLPPDQQMLIQTNASCRVSLAHE